MNVNSKTKAPTDPKIIKAVGLMIDAQRLLDRIIGLVEPSATTTQVCGVIGIDTFDPKDPRTMELHRISSRIGELRATYFGKTDRHESDPRRGGLDLAKYIVAAYDMASDPKQGGDPHRLVSDAEVKAYNMAKDLIAAAGVR